MRTGSESAGLPGGGRLTAKGERRIGLGPFPAGRPPKPFRPRRFFHDHDPGELGPMPLACEPQPTRLGGRVGVRAAELGSDHAHLAGAVLPRRALLSYLVPEGRPSTVLSLSGRSPGPAGLRPRPGNSPAGKELRSY